MTHPYARLRRRASAALTTVLALCATVPATATAAEAAQAGRPQVGPVQAEASLAWDDNLTRASDAPARLGDRIASLVLSRGATLPLATHARAVFGASLFADKLARYEGLDRAGGGLSAELQYRRSSTFDAPTLALFGELAHDEYRADQRSGTRYTLGASVRQSWTDRIDAFAAFSFSRRDARDATFDTREHGLRLHLDYAAGRLGTFYAGAEHRRGDVVSTAWGYEAEYAHPARAFSRDEAFGPGWFAYRLGGRTTLWTLGWSLPLGPGGALDLSWRQANSAVRIAADPAGGYGAETLRYRSSLYSISYLLRF